MGIHYSEFTVITEENFSIIYDEYYALLIRYAYAIVRNKEMAQDIIADVFCELWNSKQKLNIHTSLKNYLLISVRRMANRQLLKLNIESKKNSSSNLKEEDPHVKILQKENAILLNKLFATLSLEKQDILQLRMVGLTYNEIALVLDITPKKVEYHLQTAITLLHEEIKSKPHLKELSFLFLLSPVMYEITIW